MPRRKRRVFAAGQAEETEPPGWAGAGREEKKRRPGDPGEEGQGRAPRGLGQEEQRIPGQSKTPGQAELHVPSPTLPGTGERQVKKIFLGLNQILINRTFSVKILTRKCWRFLNPTCRWGLTAPAYGPEALLWPLPPSSAAAR